MENHFYHISWPPLIVTIFITHVLNCVMGAMPMQDVHTLMNLWKIKFVSHDQIVTAQNTSILINTNIILSLLSYVLNIECLTEPFCYLYM